MATKTRSRKKKEEAEGPDEMAAATEALDDAWEASGDAGDVDDFDHLKLILSGASGAGKSRAAALFERPLIGLTELQAIPTIKKANPKAVIYRRNKDTPYGIHTYGDLRRFLRMAQEAGSRGHDAVVLDSLTDAQRIIRTYYTRNQGAKAGKDKTSQESWGIVIDKTAAMLRTLRDIPAAHLLVTCIDREIESGDEGLIHRFGVSGKNLPKEISQYFNMIGYAYRVEMAGGIRHQVLFRGDDRFMTKPMDEIDDIEPPEPLLWVEKTMGKEAPKEVHERVKQWHDLASERDDEEEPDDDNDGDNE